MTEQKGNGYQGIRAIQASHLSAKTQEVTSSVAITEKMKNNLCQTTAKYTRDPRVTSR